MSRILPSWWLNISLTFKVPFVAWLCNLGYYTSRDTIFPIGYTNTTSNMFQPQQRQLFFQSARGGAEASFNVSISERLKLCNTSAAARYEVQSSTTGLGPSRAPSCRAIPVLLRGEMSVMGWDVSASLLEPMGRGGGVVISGGGSHRLRSYQLS